MTKLDATEVYNKFDPSNMIGRIGELPQQCRKAWQSALDIPLPSDYCNVDKVIILGMGGSAIGGDLVQTMTSEKGNISVQVNRDYNLPQSVDENTLVIASSYSGNTEETLSAFSQALQTYKPSLRRKAFPYIPSTMMRSHAPPSDTAFFRS